MTAEELLQHARSCIATAVVGGAVIPRRLGEIALHEDQWRAAQQALTVVKTHRGVLIANDVGSGKTFLALAVARAIGRLRVIAPAALISLWENALARAALSAEIISVESLSRARDDLTPNGADVVIIDECHHLRNPKTKRYAAAAALCARSRVILLSATPLQNRRSDIAAQIALFLGAEAWTLSDDDLASVIVRRREARRDARLPELRGPHQMELPHEDDWLDELLSLPSPLPPADGGDGGALLAYTLVRRWASSNAALVATLERRLASALAIESALESGRWPTRAELSAWNVADGAMQLAFPELMVMPDANVHSTTLLAVVRRHRDAVRTLLRSVRGAPKSDTCRATALRAIRAAHENEIVLAFSEYAETVSALGRLLAPDGGVAWLTSRGGHTATERIHRDAILAQLAPGAVVPPAERISLLLTTDVLSEGLDLQRASVVVHLDLPWNPARLEQRVGRVRRLGSAHDFVTVYTLAPPASSDRLTRIEQRLREKIQLASRSVGVAGRILPSLFTPATVAADPSAVELRGDIVRHVSGWQSSTNADLSQDTPIAAAVGDCSGYLAALDEEGETLLVADFGGGVSTDDRDLIRAVEASDGDAIAPTLSQCTEAVERLKAWWRLRRGAAALGLRAASPSARARALTRLSSIAARTPRHERPRVTAQLELARSAVTANLSAGSERVLGALVASSLPDEAWLRAIAAFAETHVAAHQPAAQTPARAPRALPLIAMILLVPSRTSRERFLFTR